MIHILMTLVLSCASSHATEEEPFFKTLDVLHDQAQSLQKKSTDRLATPLTPDELFRRTQAVLGHFGAIPTSKIPENFFDAIQNPSPQWQRLSHLELFPEWQYFSTFATDTLTVFQDRSSKREIDFVIKTSPTARGTKKAPSPSRPLEGLRIALDPGHMGGKLWDERTGKFVRGKNGKILSEGILNLQIALLLEEKLTRQGAQVLVTHRTPTPVSRTPYEQLDIQKNGRELLSESTLSRWFLELLQIAPPSDRLYQAFRNDPAFQRLFSERMRGFYYFRKDDLDARVQMINDFDPDLALVIHLDVGQAHMTKAYVPGSFFPEEFATQEQRAHFARHFLDQPRWEKSVLLSRAIVQSFQANMGLDLQIHHGDNAKMIEPGVFSRNLNLTRKIKSPISFLECLFYDHPAEFEALSRERHPLIIDGKNYPYSDRLMDIVQSIEAGIKKVSDTLLIHEAS